MFTSVNEKKFVTLLTEGDKAAFEKLYHLYSHRLLGHLFKLVKSETCAAELLQDTFIKIWNNKHHIDPEQSFRSYIFRIAENNVYDFYRKAARDKQLQAELINATSIGYRHVEESLNYKENVQHLQHIINSLPPKRLEVFQLIKIEERSYAEVSGLLDISPSTINDHIVKANKFIQQKLELLQKIAVSIVLFMLP